MDPCQEVWTLDAPLALTTGDPLHLVMMLQGEEISLPAQVVNSAGSALRVEFDELKVNEERGLVRALYSRADAWYGWSELIKPDRPLRSWMGLIRHSLTGLPRLLAGRGRSE